MDAYVITIPTPYSQEMSRRCIKSANIPVVKYEGVEGKDAYKMLEYYGIEWTWKNDNTVDEVTGLRHVTYATKHMENRVGCFLSHYQLWLKCAEEASPLLVLEHDSLFISPFEDAEFEGACMINDPKGATPNGQWWSYYMARRGEGVWPKTKIFEDERPDGLAGNSAYLLQPTAAVDLIQKVDEVGAWPNDALMCRQFFPWLEERYPFITKVNGKESSTSG